MKNFPRAKTKAAVCIYVLENNSDVISLGDCMRQPLVFTLSSVAKWIVIFWFIFGFCILHLVIFSLVVLWFCSVLF